jgi:hypothetical protein
MMMADVSDALPGLAPPGMDPGPGVAVAAIAGLSVQLGNLTDALNRQHQLEQRYQQAIMSIPVKPHSVAVAGGVVTITSHENDLGPGTGYAWAIQRLTVGGLGTSDTVSLYKGPATAVAADPTNLMMVVTAAAPTWSPGRTGAMLFFGDTIIAAGTGLSASTVTLTGEVIQMEQWIVPQFLL